MRKVTYIISLKMKKLKRNATPVIGMHTRKSKLNPKTETKVE